MKSCFLIFEIRVSFLRVSLVYKANFKTLCSVRGFFEKNFLIKCFHPAQTLKIDLKSLKKAEKIPVREAGIFSES